MIYNRPLGGVNGVKKGVLSDISNIYHYQYFCRYVSVVKEGWTCKGASGVKGGVFKKSQRDFLLTLFNNNGGPKIRERDTHMRMSDRERIHRVQSIYPG